MKVINDAEHYTMELIANAVRRNLYIRIVCDNLDFLLRVRHEMKDKHSHMSHNFASMILAIPKLFEHLSDKPEKASLTTDDLQLTNEEYRLIRADIIRMIAQVLKKFCTHLQFLAESLPSEIGDEEMKKRRTKTEQYQLKV